MLPPSVILANLLRQQQQQKQSNNKEARKDANKGFPKVNQSLDSAFPKFLHLDQPLMPLDDVEKKPFLRDNQANSSSM